MPRTWAVVVGLCLLVPTPARADAPVSIGSDPPGATLAIDGHDVGTTPWTGTLALGTHAATARLAGHFPAQLRFDLGEGGTTLTLSLVAEPGTEETAPHPVTPPRAHVTTPPRRAERSVLDTFGPLVLAAAGAAFVVIDLASLGAVGTSADGATRTELDPVPFAMNLVVAGVALVAALVWWLIGDVHGDAPPGVTTTPEGGQAGAADVI